MSGTSLDGVDGVLVRLSPPDAPFEMELLQHRTRPMPANLRQEFLALNTPDGVNELHRASLAANALSDLYAQVVQDLMKKLEKGAGVEGIHCAAIGAHGQTVRHQPEHGYTIQLLNPALLAERCGITVIADFRSRDIAAGGQGAPLVPAFHREVFSDPKDWHLVLNIGGISNISILPPMGQNMSVLGFDCGPGNALMDAWCQRHQGRAFDADGAWAASGQVIAHVLDRLLDEPFFMLTPPKSTGRELFNLAWLNARVPNLEDFAPVDIQATLALLTARSCAQSAMQFGGKAKRLFVCGGGALNTHLMNLIKRDLPKIQVFPSTQRGLDPMHVEAAAFAWLAQRCIYGSSGNLPAVTGARGERVLGAVYFR